ncbi:lipoyl synthase [Tichowtungia aerotolerans]|uniref:Lipoyl synthase n=1 Tax=Tichowtungia aerotolerans TaxID=2697043 RepID=A0A6P1M4M9_9BACT|nr:lipoyl synthase [Tichowtungia aerotolerans]QHI69749.1 lipoyl synthase [Tichowtungia aerotolerans]
MPTLQRKRPPLPGWFKTRLPEAGSETQTLIHTTTSARSLHTVCEEAKCPNRTTCWSQGTATFMVAGKSCTRNCRFCSVDHQHAPPPPDPGEPLQLASAISALKLDYAVITVVNRDDLFDGGASHYRACLEAVHRLSPATGLELLGSDLAGDETALASLLDGAPLKVFAHNIETVERLTPNIRDPKASFAVSLRILEAAKELRPDLLTKSSLMVGLGETQADVEHALRALRKAGVDLLTIGQYLAPTPTHYPVLSFPPPEQFESWKTLALELGFRAVASGPFIRSSYRAGELYRTATEER